VSAPCIPIAALSPVYILVHSPLPILHAIRQLPFPPTHDIITQTVISPQSDGPREGNLKRTNCVLCAAGPS
jgi:hypothetical protein